MSASSNIELHPPGDHTIAPPSSTDPSAKVHVVGPNQPNLADELSRLLHRRLTNATLFMSIAMTVSLVTTLHLPLLQLRSGMLIAAIVMQVILRMRPTLPAFQLRIIESVALIVFAFQATLMPNTLISQSAAAGDYVTATMDHYFAQGIWAISLIFYGLYIPNTWRRAAAIIIPLALVPTLDFRLLALYDPAVQKAFASLHHGPPAPIVLLGAIGGIYGAHTLHTIRRDEFKAKQFGRYVLKEKLGEGGMGEVYRAEHDLLKRPCAIKLIRPSEQVDTLAIARFEREARATAQLTHPSAIEVYDYGRTNEGVFYYVMECLQGMSLHEMVAVTGPMPTARAAYFLRQIAGALRQAHSLGIIHRDITPANIFSAQIAGQYDVAKLLDFGLVRTADAPQDSGLTQKGVVCGSPMFMSPEQARASQNIDSRTDLYSLGASAYFLVTGRPPFAGENKFEIMIAHTRDAPKPPSTHNSAIGPEFDALILKCLAKSPADRFQNIEEFLVALDACPGSFAWTPHWAQLWWQKQALVAQSQSQPQGESEFAIALSQASTARVPDATQEGSR